MANILVKLVEVAKKNGRVISKESVTLTTKVTDGDGDKHTFKAPGAIAADTSAKGVIAAHAEVVNTVSSTFLETGSTNSAKSVVGQDAAEVLAGELGFSAPTPRKRGGRGPSTTPAHEEEAPAANGQP